MVNFFESKEFQTDVKRLRYSSLPSDLDTLRQVLEVEPRGRVPQIVRVSGLGSSIEVEIYKVKHFRCKSLEGKGSRSGIRIIYAYLPAKDEVIFIEAYFKNDESTDCDRQRIERYFNKTRGRYYTGK